MTHSLIIGANGQIGSELVHALAARDGAENVIATDLTPPRVAHPANDGRRAAPSSSRASAGGGRAATGGEHILFESLDVLDAPRLRELIARHSIDEVYQLAALLSATGEAAPLKAWTLNMDGLINVLELARERKIKRIFWPSSIAAFGPNSQRVDTPQLTVMDPRTMYGISKMAGERLAEYYFEKYDVDVRSLRYPGVIGYRTPPGGGVTDYAISIFQAAKQRTTYRCFLKPDARLPMIYMPDAVRATLELMQADSKKVRVRSSYNLAGLSFMPAEIAAAIARHVPGFRVVYEPDFRQDIADTWPQSIDDSEARRDWNWRPRVGLDELVTDMLRNIPLSWQDELEPARVAQA